MADNGSQNTSKRSKTKRRKTDIDDDDEDERFPERKHFMNESKSDVVFLVDGQRVPAKKGVLEINSNVFDRMFSGEYTESTAKEIMIKDTTADAFKTMIGFMYSRELMLTDDSDLQLIGDVLQCADRYRVIRLMDAIGKHLETMVTIWTMETIADMAHTYRIRGLSEAMGTRLAALLTVENVLSVATVAYKYGAPTKRFVLDLKTFLTAKFDQMVTKEYQELNALDGITNRVWLEVMCEVSKRRIPRPIPVCARYYSSSDSD